jgi:hypothetical protein
MIIFLFLRNVFTANLLSFSWSMLRLNIKFKILDKFISHPINHLWFDKTSFLIRKGSFVYKSFNFTASFVKKHFFYYIKLKVIENAFFLLLKSSFPINFYTSVKCNLEIILSWDKGINFFININIIRSYSIINRNRLKNIFLKTFKDNRFWEELDKMFLCDFLNICSSSIYKKNNILGFNVLSFFLLNIYLNELDVYIYDISITYNSRINLVCFENFLLKYSENMCFFLLKFYPLKFSKFLFYFKSFNNVRDFNFSSLFDFIYFSFKFNRSLSYVRYLHYFLLGVVGSKSFSIFIRDKIVSFLRSNLHFNVKNNFIISSVKDFIFFLGFSIKFSRVYFKKYKSIFPINYKNSLFLKLNSYKMKLNNLHFNRIKSELLLSLNLLINGLGFYSLSLNDLKIWTLIFQLESVRSTQFGKFILSMDSLDLFSSDVFSNIRYSTLFFNYKYTFNFYIKNFLLVFKDVVKNFSYFIDRSVVSLDLSLISLISDFQRRIFFFYSEINIYKPNYFISGSKLFFKNYRVNFITINIPFRYIFEKLRFLGFVHPIKKRPISNFKYLSFSDSYIIKSFGYLANSFILWFRSCYNFSRIVFVIDILRQSCFLTLCRKHNKSKSWAYSVYTPDLILFRNLSTSKSYFPTRRYLSIIKSSFLIEGNFISFFDEEFFLS